MIQKIVKFGAGLCFIVAAITTIGYVQAPHIETTSDEYARVKRQTVCLAQVIHDEARGEKLAGKIAVGHVVINRSKTWNREICGIVYHKRGKICQFSGMCKQGKPKYTKETLHIAYDLLNGSYRDNTGGATYFHATYVSPDWSNSFKKTKTIGNHIFYKTNQTL